MRHYIRALGVGISLSILVFLGACSQSNNTSSISADALASYAESPTQTINASATEESSTSNVVSSIAPSPSSAVSGLPDPPSSVASPKFSSSQAVADSTKTSVTPSEPDLPSNSDTSSQTAGTYTDSNVTFNYPPSWKNSANPGEDSTAVTFTDPTLNDYSVFSFVTGEASNTQLSTESQFQEAYSETYENFSITSFADTKVDGYSAIKLVFTYSSENVEYQRTMYDVVVGYVDFRFYFDSPISNVNDYAQTDTSIMASVQFIN